MFRYIIINWNTKAVSECAAVNTIRHRMSVSTTNWRSVLDRPGLFVSYVDRGIPADTAIPVGESGVILGTIFRSPELLSSGQPSSSGQPRPIRLLSRGQSEEILRSMGRTLIANYWGYYVAALLYAEDASVFVLRAPASPLACFHVERDTLNFFFSHLDDCIELEISPLSINWDSITAQVVGGDYLTNETAIQEINCLECGEGMECKLNGRFKHVYWDPRAFLEERSPAKFEQASQTIRRATEHSVSALSSPHDNILVNLSGGLDSSIVLSSLSRVPHKPAIAAVNYYSKGSGDERRFARSMAGSANCRLIECARNQQLDLRRFIKCNRTVQPVLNFSAPDVEARNVALARELNATAIFDGELGDNVFGSYPGPGAMVECLRQSGWTWGFIGVAMDYAVLTRQSVWRTLALARREALSVDTDPDFSASREMQRVLGPERAKSILLASREAEERHARVADRFLHPWFKQSRRIAPGSHALLFGILAVTSTTYHSPFTRWCDPPRVSPLISQPLIEIALRMPTHLHCKFGEDRAAARSAFADVLPPEILQRGLGKGSPGIWLRDVFEQNIGFLREFFLDGILVRERLIDRTKLETVLSPGMAHSTVAVGDIFAKLYIETWLRGWRHVETVSAGRYECIGG